MSKDLRGRVSRTRLKSIVTTFLRQQPEGPRAWLTGTGMLTSREREARIEFAEKFMSKQVRRWIQERGLDVELFVDANKDEDRAGFCELLASDWILTETSAPESV